MLSGKESKPITKNDFIYIPAGVKLMLSNPREEPLVVIIMDFTGRGYKYPSQAR